MRKLPEAISDVEIIMLDNMMTQRYPSLFNLPHGGRYRFYEVDLNTDDFSSLFQGANAVVHLAALTDAAGSFERSAEVRKNNLSATQTVAEACIKHQSALIFPSSTSVYGSSDKRVDEDCPNEDLRPQSPYAETKLQEELLLEQLGSNSGLRYIVCRLGTIFGVSLGMRFHTAVNKFCWQGSMAQPVTVWKTAMDQKRPYLALSDAVRAVTHILTNDLFDNRTYNVLTLNATVRDIIDEIKIHIPDLELQFIESEIMNQLSYEVADDRFKGTGFMPKGELEKGIKDTIELLSSAHYGHNLG